MLPMTKTSTFHLTINNLSSKSYEEMLNSNSAFDFEEKFTDVFEILNTLSIDVRQEVVENILKKGAEDK